MEANAEAQREAREHRARRAREVIEGAGWAFDEYVKELQDDWLNSEPHDTAGRELLFCRIRVALELKAKLIGHIQQHNDDKVIHEHKHAGR